MRTKRWQLSSLLILVCVGLVGCYPPPQPHVSVVCKTNPYGTRVCVRTVSQY